MVKDGSQTEGIRDILEGAELVEAWSGRESVSVRAKRASSLRAPSKGPTMTGAPANGITEKKEVGREPIWLQLR
jgi:hypothetical protein